LRMLAFRPETAAAATAGGDLRRAPSSRAPAPAPAAQIAPVAQITPVAQVAPIAAPASPLAPLAAVPLAINENSWPDVVAAAQLSGMARQFALNCVPASFENGVLTLRLDRSVDGRRSRAIEEKLLQGLAKYLGRDIRVIFEVADASLATPARQRAMVEQDRAQRAVTAFEEDPAVKGLRERFGAEVDAASVKPAN
jgi:hypothetical protein